MLGKNLITAAAGNAGGEVLGIEDVFSTWLYTGNGSTQTITNGIDLSGEGGLVWTKHRNTINGGVSSLNHYLLDTVRGGDKFLSSNTTNSQVTTQLITFGSTGYTLDGSSSGSINYQGSPAATFASWTFRKAAKFFDVVTWTGDGSTAAISHNLGSAPGCIIVKRTDTAFDWYVYHRSQGETKAAQLNTTDKFDNSAAWDSTAPTSTQFTYSSILNANGGTFVAYLFAHDAGGFGDGGTESVIKCGSFTTNGSGNATVDLGWEPQWVLFKNTNVGSWSIFDDMRGMPVAPATNAAYLLAQSSNAEANNGAQGYPNPTATGFVAGGLSTSSTYIYIAIRRGPMKTPTDATKVFNAVISTASLTPYSIGFPTDMAIIGYRSGSANYAQTVGTRLTGDSASLFTSQTVAEKTNAGVVWSFDLQNSFNQQWNGSSPSWNFRRAPSFMDVVAYTGTGVARTVSHNLGVAPELMIVKHRSDLAFTGSNRNWAVYFAPGGASASLNLNTSNAQNTSGFFWNSTNPTDSVFSIDDTVSVNYNGTTYIAYLFATCPGVSKCFNFTGTGTTLQIDCGFASGARFVMIKRTDSTGDWYVWDSARGIISGNDPYLLLNSTAAEVTSTDYIDPYSAGFEISSTAPAAINANGGSYIGLAIA